MKRPRWATLTNLERLLLAGPIALVAVLAYRHRWTSDDGFVYFRVVDQIRAGNGPVFNAGERVEAVASPIWTAVLTLGDAISPLRLEYTAAVLSTAAMVGGLALATGASARLVDPHRGPRSIRFPLGLAVFAALWPVWVWSTGGTEIAIAICWLGACFHILSRWATPATGSPFPTVGAAGLVLLGLGWLIRPELAVSSVVFVGTVVIVSAKSTRRRVTMVASAAAVPVLYQLFRMGYYGMIASSASVAREDSTPRPGFGWDYFTDFVSPYLLLVPIVVAVLGGLVPLVVGALNANDGAGADRRAVVAIVVAASGLANIVIVVVFVGGDDVHARLLLPGLFALLAPVFVAPVTRRYVEALAVTAVWAACCGPLMRPPSAVDASRPFSNGYPGPGLTYEDSGIEERGPQPWMDGPGLYVADPFAPTGVAAGIALADPDRTVVASQAVGLLGYALGPDVDVLDLYGTADPVTGHQALDGRVIPGQEKSAYAPWLVARLAADPAAVRPDALVLGLPYGIDSPPLASLEQVPWAEAALTCGPFEQLIDAYTRPLTTGRFFGNIWNAMSNTSLRFDAMPRDAYRWQGCGPTPPDDVVAFYEDVSVDASLSADPAAGDVAVAGRCDTVYLPSADSETEEETDSEADDEVAPRWDAVEGHTFTATIELDPERTEADFAAVFTIGPFGHDTAVVWVQTDGDGNYRIVQELNWFPSVDQQWTPIVEGEPVVVSIVPDLNNKEWQTTVDGGQLSRLPMLGENVSGDGTFVAAVPQRAAPGASHPTITHDPPLISRTCQSILAHHPTPPRGAPVAPSEFQPIPS